MSAHWGSLVRWRDALRRLARWGVWGLAALLVLGIALAGFVLYPIPLFPHHRDVGEFSVHSDERIDDGLAAVVADASRRVRSSELYRSDQRYRVYLSHSRRKYAFFSALARRRPESQALVFTRTNSTIVSLDGVAAMRQRSGGQPRNTRLEGSLGYAIAHEVAHLQAAATLRVRGEGPLPYWISEGWADATAAASSGDGGEGLVSLARTLMDEAAWRPPRRPEDRRHLRWHVEVAYLLQVRGLDFAQLAETSLSEDEVWSELQTWLARRGRVTAGHA